MRDVGVYVHVPFCERVCPYCDFAVVAARPLGDALASRYTDALLRELERRRSDFAGRRLASLYLGGGTPSLLPPGQVARIAGAVRRAFEPAGPVELTLEVNPSTLERERLPDFREAGVNRVSVGVQSFDDTTLRRLGRAHRAEEAQRTLARCREAGFDALALDLIFGAPGQSLAGFESDLARAVDFGPDHVSTYELGFEPGTPFGAAARDGRLAPLPEDLLVRMHETAEARLTAAGYARYELSNYARPGREAVHNRRYWERRPVLGLGMGAVSLDPRGEGAPFGVRRENHRDLSAYLDAVESGRSAEASSEVLPPETARGEAIFLALRTARGLDAAGFAEEFGGPPRAFRAPEIEALVSAELLREAPSGDLRLSRRGRLLSDSVFARLL